MTDTKNTMISTVESWRPDIASQLTSDVDIDKFIAAVTVTLTMNPQIFVECTHDSIKNACIKAAYDGLRPDGKEGALVKYWNKDAIVPGSNTKGANEAQWMPMVYGVRKKAKEKDGIIIVANVVYKNDIFELTLGDEEKLEHKPAPPDEDPGPIVASYAIFKKGDEILHREIMRKKDIDAVRAASKSPNSPAWSRWEGEMAKKAAVNRGSKTVTLSDATRQVIDRDNDLYDVGNMRDITPAKAVDLQNRFAGRGGVQAGNVQQSLSSESSAPMENMEEGERETVDASRQQNNSNSSSGSTPHQRTDDEAGGDTSPRLPAGTFQEYSSALFRFSSAETVQKGHDRFWEGRKGKPQNKDDERLVKIILSNHIKRANGELDADKLKNGVDDAISDSFKL